MPKRLLILLSSFLLFDGSAFLAPNAVVVKTKTTTMSRPTPGRRLTTSTELNMLELFDGAIASLVETFLPIPVLTEATIELPTLLTATQVAGEATFASSVVIAAMQGALIMHQYSSNPAGELIAPTGLTIGVEDATKDDQEPNRDDHAPLPLPLPIISPYVTDQNMFEAQFVPLRTFAAPSSRTTPSTTALSMMADSSAAYNNAMAFRCEPESTSSSSASHENKSKDLFFKLNKFLPLMLPVLASHGSLTVLEHSHVLHFGVIMALAKVFDFFHRVPDGVELSGEADGWELGDEPNVVVLGDSMAVGIGCLDVWDKEKDSSVIHKQERLELSADGTLNAVSPIFPKELARTLSKRIGKPVKWRSAGVDGGDTTEIRSNLLDVVQDEVDKGQPPDVVVVLTGANDLKKIISVSPESGPGASVRGFQSNLVELVKDVRAISPKTRVVFPALPTYRLDSQSIMNVFPLNFFLDRLISTWDSQKIEAAKKCSRVHYYGLSAKDVNGWYEEEQMKNEGKCVKDHDDVSKPSLLSADGIHPNALSYRKWGSFVGDKIADTLLQEKKTQHQEGTGAPSTRAFLTSRRRLASV